MAWLRRGALQVLGEAPEARPQTLHGKEVPGSTPEQGETQAGGRIFPLSPSKKQFCLLSRVKIQ